ncbi:uncharacterized protein LOC114364302, partial [Ostrinia furnacalis]|uniref:uncharacterized protein LOC114364302 n=1 Tax=Ostrinia furnacalis TaxID=93504 RepID=UPI0010403233
MADKFDCLPILVVSAKDQNSANIIISEIIGDDSENRTDGDNNAKRVWKLVNKYYTADVQFHTILDGQELDTQLADAVEAHLIYLTADECAGDDASELMRSRARGLGAAQVRVAAADTAEPAPGLARAAAAAR